MAAAEPRGVTLASPSSLCELARAWGGDIDVAAERSQVVRIVAPRDARQDDDLVLLTSAKELERARAATGVILCTRELAPRLGRERRWVHACPLWVLAELLAPVQSARDAESWWYERAPTGVSFGPGARVDRRVRIGEGSAIGANAVVYAGVTLGSGVSIGANSVIGAPGFGWTSAPSGVVIRVPHLAGVIIEPDVAIGPLCTVDAGVLTPTLIGRGAKIDAHVHVGHNVHIGAGALIAAQVGFAGSTVLEAGVLVGGQAGFADHVHVGKGARVAAKSGVIGDVPAGETVAGFPAVRRSRWLRAMARLLRSS